MTFRPVHSSRIAKNYGVIKRPALSSGKFKSGPAYFISSSPGKRHKQEIARLLGVMSDDDRTSLPERLPVKPSGVVDPTDHPR